MKLEYEEIEDNYDDITKIRTMTEQATVHGKGLLLRTTVYSQHNVNVSVVFVPDVSGFEPLVK